MHPRIALTSSDDAGSKDQRQSQDASNRQELVVGVVVGPRTPEVVGTRLAGAHTLLRRFKRPPFRVQQSHPKAVSSSSTLGSEVTSTTALLRLSADTDAL